MIFENSTILARSCQVITNSKTDEVYLVKDGIVYGLNPAGRRVWELIQQPVEVSKVRDILLEEYAVEPERCTRELIELLENLVAQGLTERVDG